MAETISKILLAQNTVDANGGFTTKVIKKFISTGENELFIYAPKKQNPVLSLLIGPRTHLFAVLKLQGETFVMSVYGESFVKKAIDLGNKITHDHSISVTVSLERKDAHDVTPPPWWVPRVD